MGKGDRPRHNIAVYGIRWDEIFEAPPVPTDEPDEAESAGQAAAYDEYGVERVSDVE